MSLLSLVLPSLPLALISPDGWVFSLDISPSSCDTVLLPMQHLRAGTELDTTQESFWIHSLERLRAALTAFNYNRRQEAEGRRQYEGEKPWL